MMTLLKLALLVRMIKSFFRKGSSRSLFFIFLAPFLFTWTASGRDLSQDPAILEKIHQLKLGQDLQWRRLLHYKESITGGSQSQVIGKTFFLSPNGAVDSDAELLATLKILSLESEQPSDKNDLPVCLFPARKEFLKIRLGLQEQDFLKADCALFQRFLLSLQPEKVSFVFSSYFTNNPGSAFGHTLFRIHKSKKSEESGSDLLDHGIGYAASVQTDNPFIFALFGIFGGFPGEFSNLPFYYKVREYNDFESRDLWDYELNLHPDEVKMLVYHLWELGNTHFRYFFFTQNCAYHMLTSLEAAAPRFNLSAEVKPWMIPVDAINIINNQPGLVKNIKYRASMAKQFYSRFQSLEDSEKNNFLKFKKNLDTQILRENHGNQSRVKILDTAIDYIDMKNPDLLSGKKNSVSEIKQKLLVERSEIEDASQPIRIPVPMEDAPHQGHATNRWGLLGVRQDDISGLVLDFRFSLHDLLDPEPAYLKYSKLDFGRFRFFSNSSTHFKLLSADIVNLATFNPVNEIQTTPSWRLQVGARNLHSLHEDILDPFVEGGVGYSYSLNDQLIFGLFEGGAHEKIFFTQMSLGVILKPLAKLKILFEQHWGLETMSNKTFQETQVEMRWHLQPKMDLNFEYLQKDQWSRAIFGGYFFF